ncbi:Eco57I restriction-modification methylase domain-containing protein [Elizabethkingia anophelis]|nr:Eco57I restriction-modification methylase domain-containing protein [Elizabethkingia anophelis]
MKKQFSQDPVKIDRLIVSAFFRRNKIPIPANEFLRQYYVEENKQEELFIVNEFLDIYDRSEEQFTFEMIIQLFEFVISPSDKTINGAVYTPEYIRNYIVNQSIEQYDNVLTNVKAADISCGCGGFLLTLAQKIHQVTGKSYFSIYNENIYGVDIAEYSIQRCKILLALYAYLEGETDVEFNFNLFTDNSLTFDWAESCEEIRVNGGFDLIVGNPPYVCSRNMEAETLKLLERWEVSSTGHPDLYIPFFQIGIENINNNGILAYITVNTFIKSVNGRALRNYFANQNINLKLLNFGGEQIFNDRNTYTCICFIRRGEGFVDYKRVSSNELEYVNFDNLRRFNYQDLNHFDGWNLVNSESLIDFLEIIESTGVQFKDLYNTKNGIATLKNDVYKFKPVDQDDQYFYLNDNGIIYKIEHSICRDIVNANKIKREDDVLKLREKIIFPYDKQIRIIPEDEMKTNFPNAYAYLISKREVLSKRDKGNREYEAWYAYGRRQSMDINAYKLFFPHICERPTFVICKEQDLLFYNGMAIVSNDLDKLILIKKIMETDLFFNYIKNTTKDYSSGYISMSRNYLKNFGVYQFSEAERMNFLNCNKPNQFLEKLYKITNILEHV